MDAGTIDLSTALAFKTITISQVVTRGLYWLCSVKQGSNTASLVGGNTSYSHNLMPSFGSANIYDFPAAFTKAAVTGALPDPYASTATNLAFNSFTPFVFVRYV